MLEGLASWLLQTYIGKYVHVNPEKLSIGLLSGYVELENLSIKKEVFNDLNLPLEVKFGHIGKIKLNISLNKLRNTPWQLIAEDLYLIIGPKRATPQHHDDDQKLQKLDSLESKWFKQIELFDTTLNPEQTSWFSFGFVAYNLVKNLVVSINNLHIRYEDHDHNFAFGVHFEKIQIRNEEADVSTEDAKHLSIKFFEINGIDLYSDSSIVYRDTDDASIINEMRRDTAEYLIKPTSFKLKLTRNTAPQPLKKLHKSRVTIDTVIDNFEAKISSKQIEYLLEIWSLFDAHKKRMLIASYPNKWQYLLSRITATRCKRSKKLNLTTYELSKWIKEMTLYKRAVFLLYQNKLQRWGNPTLVANPDEILGAELHEHKKRIESEWDFERLKCVRRLLFDNFIKSSVYKEFLIKMRSEAKNAASGWTSKGVYGYLTWRVTSYWSSAPAITAETNQIDDEVMGLINDSIEDESLAQRDTTLAEMDFKLNTASLSLRHRSCEFLELRLDSSEFHVEMRPRHGSYLLKFNLASIYVVDKFNAHSKFPQLISPKVSQSREPCFQFSYEHKPIGTSYQPNTNGNLMIKSKSLDIVCNHQCMSSLKSFIEHLMQLRLQYSSLIKTSSLSDLKNSINDDNEANLRNSIDRLLDANSYISNTIIDVELHAPNLVFPQDIFEANTNVIIVDFGCLTFFNNKKTEYRNSLQAPAPEKDSEDDEEEIFATPASSPPTEPEINRDSPEEQRLQSPRLKSDSFVEFYSNYKLSLSDLQVLIGKSSDTNLRHYLDKGHSELHMLEKFNIDMNIQIVKLNLNQMHHKSFSSSQCDDEDDLWPIVKFSAEISLIKMHIDYLKLLNVAKIVNDLRRYLNSAPKTPQPTTENAIPTSYSSSKMIYSLVSIKLNELNLAMSTIDDHQRRLSLAELKIYDVNCRVRITETSDKYVKFTIFGLLLIDARQIYDYHLLAASHKHIRLDTSTGNLRDLNNSTTPFLRHEPLINFEMTVLNANNYSITASFNTLDLVLNPETLSELVILFYKAQSSINLSMIDEDEKTEGDGEATPKIDLKYNLTLSFNFHKLSLLLISIDEHCLSAHKVALFSISGAALDIDYSYVNSLLDATVKLQDLSCVDLTDDAATRHKHIFGIDNEKSKENLFEVCYKKERLGDNELKSALSAKTASLVYLHSAKFIFHLKRCLGDFRRFHEKILNEIAEQAASLALKMLKKGSSYLQNMMSETEAPSSAPSSTKFHLDVSLKTPIVILPMKVNSTKLLVTHLGHINIRNLDFSTSSYVFNLKEMSLFSVDEAEKGCKSYYERLFEEPKSGLNKLIDNTSLCLMVNASQDSFELDGFVENSCQMYLSKGKYEQLIQSLSENLIYDEAKDVRRVSENSSGLVGEFCETMNGEQAHSIASQSTLFSAVFQNLKSEIKSTKLNLNMKFAIRHLLVRLFADIDDEEDGNEKEIACLEFNDYNMCVTKSEPLLTYVDMDLKSIYLSDKLTSSAEDNYLLISVNNSSHAAYEMASAVPKSRFVSQSLPATSSIMSPVKNAHYESSTSYTKLFDISEFYENLNNGLSTSLPSRAVNPLDYESNTSLNLEPATPPPSRYASRIHLNSTRSESMNNLNAAEPEPLFVSIKLVLVDERHQQFATIYQSIKKFIKIKFSNLQLRVNPETWIMLLDLLGKGSNAYADEEPKPISTPSTESTQPKSSTSIEFEVQHFTIILNKDAMPQTQFDINNIVTFIETKHSYIKAYGKLGYLAIDDISPHRGLYVSRFVTSGKQALEFDFFRYDAADVHLRRAYDSALKLRMSSVKYVHVQRFVVNLSAYFQQFNALHDALGRMRALSLGKLVTLNVQRSQRILLDIKADSPIVVMPHHSDSNEALVFNLGNIRVENRFQRADSEGTIAFGKSHQPKNDEDLPQNDDYKCLLDIMSIELTDMDLYSALRLDYVRKYDPNRPESAATELYFGTFKMRQVSGNILRKRSHLFVHCERNLEKQLSHNSPDWSVRAQLSSVDFSLDLKQYRLVRGILDHNIGEPIAADANAPNTLLISNPSIETVLTGLTWKPISIEIDMDNVGIELLLSHANATTDQPESSLAYLAFIKSKLIFEGFSDQSKVVDLVSNEIIISDTRKHDSNVFTEILQNPFKRRPESLQLEIHYRSNKVIHVNGERKLCNRASILINNCRVIAIFDWLVQVKNFIFTGSVPIDATSRVPKTPLSVPTPKETAEMIVKLNLTNTDLVVVENKSNPNSQACILRTTAFMEYNELKRHERLFNACLQSVELFSCFMKSIEDTALSIMDPLMFNINFERIRESDDEYTVNMSTECFKLRLSYLDFELFSTVFESIKHQFGSKVANSAENSLTNETDEIFFSEFDENIMNSSMISAETVGDEAPKKGVVKLKSYSINMDRFCLCIIDDCKDVDVPLMDIQFSRFKVSHTSAHPSQGNAEFALNVDYYNRFLSGWEPLVEPWLARLDWKLRRAHHSLTFTSMDILNINITNAFMRLISSVITNWKDDYAQIGLANGLNKRHKLFQPYKLLNLTGSKVKFVTYEDTSACLGPNASKNDSNTESYAWYSAFERRFSDHSSALMSTLRPNSSTPAQLNKLTTEGDRWVVVEKNGEKEFNFYKNTTKARHSTLFEHKNATERHNYQLREIVQHRLRVKLLDTDGEWSEIEPLSINKVGTYYRDVKRMNVHGGTISHVDTTRLIFDISLSKNAIKLVKIVSPVTVRNRLKMSVQIRVEAADDPRRVKLRQIDSNSEWSVPIRYLPCRVHVRPILPGHEFDFSATYATCNHAQRPGDTEYAQHKCASHSTDAKFFFFTKVKRLPIHNAAKDSPISGHIIQIEPALTLYNLLPVEFGFKLDSKTTSYAGKLDAYKSEYFSNIDATCQFNISIALENYEMTKPLEINAPHTLTAPQSPTAATDINLRAHLMFVDRDKRLLVLTARVHIKQSTNGTPSCPIQVYISAQYCFFNLTGLPLVFKQAFCKEAAGQFEEHEAARSNQAFLFSFNDPNSAFACSMRIGRQCNEFKSSMKSDACIITPKWCKPFSIESGSSFRPLHVLNNTASGAEAQFVHPDWVYYIGIEVKKGKGLLKGTKFVYFTTRYYLVNKSSRDIDVCQYYAIESQRRANATQWRDKSSKVSVSEGNECLVLLTDSMTQFHWPRTDRDQLLSVRYHSDALFNWSCGFKIDSVDSFCINLRNMNQPNEMAFLRVEIVLDGGTFFIVISDASNIPPPIRIDNDSEVEVFFAQLNQSDDYCTFVKSKKSMAYAWDESTAPKKLVIGTKGGTKEVFDLAAINEPHSKDVYYENFIYIAFSESFDATGRRFHSPDDELVLTVVKGNKLVAARKESGNRAQLWRMTVEGLLVHEGSSAPDEFKIYSNIDITNRYVLDIEEIAPQPNRKLALTLSKPDARRNNTQKWAFTDEGYLCCKVKNMCLQVDGELKAMARVVLGPMLTRSVISETPAVMKISRQRLRPGSGHLRIDTLTDGPTIVLKICNVNHISFQRDSVGSIAEKAGVENNFEVYVNLSGGIGISMVNWQSQEYEELVYTYFKAVEVNFERSVAEQRMALRIDSIQACNQLLNSKRKNLLYIQVPVVFDAESDAVSVSLMHKCPAVNIALVRQFNAEQPNLILLKTVSVAIADVNLQIEEELLWKLFQFIGFEKDVGDSESLQRRQQHRNLAIDTYDSGEAKFDVFNYCGFHNLTNNYYRDLISSLIANSQSTKYCFSEFKIEAIRMSLSVYKTSKLSPELSRIKARLGIPLIQFENARIELSPFVLVHEYDSLMTISNIVAKYYTQELKSHAMRILGSVDFLGNPLGLYADFMDSFSSVLTNGDVTEFVFNLTHGVANSASRFTSSLSNELTELTLDENHQETRETIRTSFNNGSFDHFIGGALGFAVGIFGGLTSVVSQTYRGFSKDGVSGAVVGFGKGAIGTISKPVVGVLDLANGVASAIRETSRTADKMEIPRIRETRCCSTPGALLTPFSRSDSNGQKLLYLLNNYFLQEKFIALEQLDSSSEPLVGLVTNERVIFINDYSYEHQTPIVIYQATYRELKGMRAVEENGKVFMELFLENPDNGETKTPRIKCESRPIFNSFSNKVRFAKVNYDETKYAIANVFDSDE